MQESKYVYPLYDLTCSPLTSGAYDDKEEANAFKLKETLFGKHNFGMLNVSGPRTDRVLKITIHDKDGKEVWAKKIKARDLRYKR
jgi:alkaline phosphatase D